MEVKNWAYEEFPEFTDPVEGATVLKTTGDKRAVRYYQHIEYANVGGTPLHLELLLPSTRDNPEPILPCVVFVQGSAWMKQEVAIQLPMVAKLAERGYVVAIVEYRHSGIAPFPAQAVDTRNAIRFLRKNAATYRIDPEKIIVSGDSSGGHTAMFAGIIHDDDTPDNLFPGISGEAKGIVNYYGSVSVLREDDNPSTVNYCLPNSPEGMEMGGINLRERPDLRKKLTVECNINAETEIAPTLILHGTKDRTVNTRQSVSLYRKMKELGKDVHLYLLEGADHSGAEFWTAEVLDIVQSFIEMCLNS